MRFIQNLETLTEYYSSEEEAKQKLYDIVEKVCGDDKILLYGEY